jgi:uncharacterized protein (TIGR03118 family)
VAVVGSSVYVAYAKQDAGREEEIAGHNLGFVDKYTDFGQTVQRIASRGNLNAPWGLAIAPPTFGKFAGALLVGNFSDGRSAPTPTAGTFSASCATATTTSSRSTASGRYCPEPP